MLNNQSEELLSFGKSINSIIKKSLQDQAPRFNIMSQLNIAHYENMHSDLISYFLNPDEIHKSPEFGQSFLKQCRKSFPDLIGTEIRSSIREKTIDANRRIDLYIHTEKDEVIIIENKVYADDQPNQLADYYKWATDNPDADNNVFLIYLTLFPSTPSEISISQSELDKLIENKKYDNFTYEKDILNWLYGIERKVKEQPKSEQLHSGVKQYIETIKELCQLTETTYISERIIMETFINKYKALLQSDSRYQINELLEIQKEIEMGVIGVTIIQFLIAVHDTLIDKGNLSVNFTKSQKRFSDVEKWKKAIIDDPENVGVEVLLSKDDDISIGIEFFQLSSKSHVTFGIMSHVPSFKGARRDATEYNSILSKIFNGKVKNQEGNWWFEYYDVEKWFVEALFSPSWENHEKKNIIHHVVDNWFSQVIEKQEQSFE